MSQKQTKIITTTKGTTFDCFWWMTIHTNTLKNNQKHLIYIELHRFLHFFKKFTKNIRPVPFEPEKSEKKESANEKLIKINWDLINYNLNLI